MSARLLRPDESLEPYLEALPLIDPDPFVRSETKRLLKWHRDPETAQSLSSISRVIGHGRAKGHVSANLISRAKADRIEREGTKEAVYDFEAVMPLSEDELRRSNRASGSVLFLTSFFWTVTGTQDDILFASEAVDHIMRWFEGNTVESVMFSVRQSFLPFVEPLLASVEPNSYSRVQIGSEEWLFRVHGPWRPVGLSAPWFLRVLRQYPDPDHALQNKHLQSRILHEFRFDIEAAVEGCIESWRGSGRQSSSGKYSNSSVNGWRTDAAKELGLNLKGEKRLPILENIQALFEDNPRLLTLY